MPFTTRQATVFLEEHYQETIDGVAVLGAGVWSEAFSFRRAGSDFVLRLGAHREDFGKDQLAAGFSANALPIPRVLEIGRAFDGHFAVSERAFGVMLDELDPGAMRQVVPSVLEMLDAARMADLSATRGYGGWDATAGNAPHHTWREYVLALASAEDVPTSRIAGWRRHLESSPAAIAAFRTAGEHLGELVRYCPEGRHLVHGDLLNRNVMVTNGRISAVFDWGNAVYGDFVYDLAWFVQWAPEFPAMRGIDWEAEATRHYGRIGLSVPHLHERLLCYRLYIALDSLIYLAFTARLEELELEAARILRLTGS